MSGAKVKQLVLRRHLVFTAAVLLFLGVLILGA